MLSQIETQMKNCICPGGDAIYKHIIIIKWMRSVSVPFVSSDYILENVNDLVF